MLVSGGRSRKAGFTIVELLIVIVVIAILAAISVAAYNGIQDRAQDTARNTAARQALTLVQMYHAEHGAYPETRYMSEGLSASCLGEGWPTRQGGDEEVCWNIYADGTLGSSTFMKHEATDQALAQYGEQPVYPQGPVWSGVHTGVGRQMDLKGLALYHLRPSANPDSTYELGHSLIWIVSDSGECSISGVAVNSFKSHSGTVCVVHLGD